MRKLLGTATLGVIILGLVGLVRGWLSVSTNSESDQSSIELTIDKERLKQDTDRLKDGVQNLSERVRSSSGEGIDEFSEPVLPPGADDSTRFVLPPDPAVGRRF